MPDRSFELELDAEFARFNEEVLYFSKNIAEQLLRDILAGNPYWSGRSKASWVVSLGGPVEFIADVAKRKGAISEAVADQMALETLKSLENFQVGDNIFITQGNFYIAWIEDGTWGSNPGFIAAAISRYSGLGNFSIIY